MTTLFVEPFGGMAGDMFLAALLDLEDPRFNLTLLRELSEALVPGESRLELAEVRRRGLRGSQLDVQTPETGSTPHRRLPDLVRLVQASPLPAAAQRRSLSVLRRIALAEGRVHGKDPESVAFHEVGAVDTLIDVCGAALALERLGVERVLATPPVCGSGTVHCAHGAMPVPTPAVTELMRGLPLALGGGEGERLTPTGAALLADITDEFEPQTTFSAERVGWGAGTRDPEDGPPNLMRVQLSGDSGCEQGARHDTPRTTVCLLEVNLDDVSGEDLGYCVRGLREAGALDVWSVPVQMKKDRPGVVLSALCRPEQRSALERAVFERTPSLGLRWSNVERTECERSSFTVEVHGVLVRIKQRIRPGAEQSAVLDLSPEHDDLIRLAEQASISIAAAHWTAMEKALQKASEKAPEAGREQ